MRGIGKDEPESFDILRSGASQYLFLDLAQDPLFKCSGPRAATGERA